MVEGFTNYSVHNSLEDGVATCTAVSSEFTRNIKKNTTGFLLSMFPKLLSISLEIGKKMISGIRCEQPDARLQRQK